MTLVRRPMAQTGKMRDAFFSMRSNEREILIALRKEEGQKVEGGGR